VGKEFVGDYIVHNSTNLLRCRERIHGGCCEVLTTTTLILGQGSLLHVRIVKYADMPAGSANFLDQAFVRAGCKGALVLE
jgi:hypothetical protein